MINMKREINIVKKNGMIQVLPRNVGKTLQGKWYKRE